MIDFSTIKNIHFVGIGGVSLSSLAEFLHYKGYNISGSDANCSEKLDELSLLGCDVYQGLNPDKVRYADILVYSSAVKKSNLEIQKAQCLGIPTIERLHFLRELQIFFSSTIAVSGTHGKTTTTAILTKILHNLGCKFYGHIGGETLEFGNSYYSGDDIFLSEACEYRKSLLCLKPDISIVLNVENDHPDTYKNLEEIYDTFDTFIEQSKLVIINGDCPYYTSRQKSNQNLVTVGENLSNQYIISNIIEYKNGYYQYDLSYLGIQYGTIRLPILGKHNIMNSAMAFVASRYLRLCPIDVREAIESFTGVARRFCYHGFCCGGRIYDDYAHHPSEILTSIATAKSLAKNNRLFVVFQPHTYSRTKLLLNEFVKSFTDVDTIIIAKEYPSREIESDGINAYGLYSQLKNTDKYYFDNILDLASFIVNTIMPDDILLILGAGDINVLAKILTNNRC